MEMEITSIALATRELHAFVVSVFFRDIYLLDSLSNISSCKFDHKKLLKVSQK